MVTGTIEHIEGLAAAAHMTGRNGCPIWQSYLAGPLNMLPALLAVAALVAYGGTTPEIGSAVPTPEDAFFRVTPYVQHPSTNAMSILWVVDRNAWGMLEVWKASEWTPEHSNSVFHSVRPREATELDYFGYSHPKQHLPAGTQWLCQYRLADLEPDTQYGYCVYYGNGESYTGSFRTAPMEFRPVRFIAYSDSETQPSSTGDRVAWEDYRIDNDANPRASSRKYLIDQTDGYANNIRTMAAREPDFFVIAGDLAEKGSDQTHWDEFWRHNAGELNDPAGSIPILASPGNHEYHGYYAADDYGERGMRKFLAYFEFEPNGADVDADQQERFHRLDYGPVAVIFIDTNNGQDYYPDTTSDMVNRENGTPNMRDTTQPLFRDRCRAPDFNPGSAQYRWLEEQLADAQTNRLFTFLVSHQCPFSVGYHGRLNGEYGSESSPEYLSGAATRCLTNLVFKYGVDAWICGHDEMYEHSQLTGAETLPDGTKRAHMLNVYDVGMGGDGLRGCRRTDNPNPYEVYRAHVDSPEVYDATGTLISGGKHYGHLEVNVTTNEAGMWTATLTPTYVFVSSNTVTGAITTDSRTYPDEIVITNAPTAIAHYFPRTATAGQDGSAEHPYEIADAAGLMALQAAVANLQAARSLCYVQTADIDMAGVSGFYGIGWFTSSDSYASLPPRVADKADIPFAGVYDGGGHTISNVTLVRHNYAGVFNNVSGTVRNLTVRNIGFSGTCSQWGCAIVGNAQGNALLENLTSAGAIWGDTANHNIAGTVVRVQNAVTIRGCVNDAPLTTVSRRLGGIVSFTANTAPLGTITIEGCTNNAALRINADGGTAGDRGVGGIIARPESTADGLAIRNCASFGALANGGVPQKVGGIVGELDPQNYVDDGGNTFPAAFSPVGNCNGKTVTGLAYATASTVGGIDCLTTVKAEDISKGNTYTLLVDIAASSTPVVTLSAVDEMIAFDAARGFSFGGTVAVEGEGLEVVSAAVGTVTAYSAQLMRFTVSVDGMETIYTYGDRVTFTAPEPVEADGRQVVTLGTTFTDAVTNQFTVTVTNDIAFAWDVCATNWWFEIGEPQYGAIIAPDAGWKPDGSTFTITAVPAAHCQFAVWTGDTDGCTENGAELAVAMDRARTIGAEFEAEALSLAEAVNAESLDWTTGGAACWRSEWTDCASDGLHDACCGAIGSGTNAWIATTVDGPGTIAFKWKSALASQNTKYQFMVDGEVKGMLTGTNGWTATSATVIGGGAHEVKWRLLTGRSGSDSGDMAALDEVAWRSDDVPPPAATQTTPVPVPYAELERRFSAYLEQSGGDYEAAAHMTGRNGCPIWQSYLAGLDPDAESSRFIAKIAIVGGKPVVTWEPDTPELRATRIYGKLGKRDIGDPSEEWTEVKDGDEAGYHFFKVTVELP